MNTSKGVTHDTADRLHKRLESILAISGCILALASDEEDGVATPESMGRMWSLTGALEELVDRTQLDISNLKSDIHLASQLRLVAKKNPAPKAD